MKTHVGKNYFTDDGNTLVIGGAIQFEEGAAAPIENQAASTADTVAKLKTDFNNLLAALKASGLMEPDEVDNSGNASAS